MGGKGEGSGGEGEGSGVKGGGKWGLGTPLSTPSKLPDFTILNFNMLTVIISHYKKIEYNTYVLLQTAR